MYRSAVLCFVLCAIGGCQANTFRMGGCPRVVVMKDVDFERFVGDWYVIQRFNPMATCTKITFERLSDGNYTLNEEARPFGIHFGVHTPLLKARRLEFLKNGTNSIFRTEKDFAHFTLSTFGIIDTDYNNYALVWGCDPVLIGSVQNVDLLSRIPDPQPEVIKAARDVLKDMAIDFTQMDNVDHSSCSDNNMSTQGSNTEDTNNMMLG